MRSFAQHMCMYEMFMPEDKEQLALAMNGKKRNIRRKDFLVFAEECGLTRTSAEKNDDGCYQTKKFIPSDV